MKPYSFGGVVNANFPQWAENALRQIERDSFQSAESVFNAITVTGDYVETRSFDTDTATVADVVNLVATLINDIKALGQNGQG